MARLAMQFTIRDFLVYILCVSAVLGSRIYGFVNAERRFAAEFGTGWVGPDRRVVLPMIVCVSLLEALALSVAACSLALPRRERLSEPGHWILGISGVGIILSVVSGFIVAKWFTGDIQQLEAAHTTVALIGAGIIGTGFVIAIRRPENTGLWRVWFGCGIALTLAGALAEMASYLTLSSRFDGVLKLFGLGGGLVLIGAVLRDARGHKSRTLRHWLGVGYAILSQCLSLFFG